ncbi:MAG: GNAT family N-acetyltransferase [Methanomassiliicoccales archaeon]|nr:GNAT family N-acetyltransferase [Methanomassiliicoccales archaeon]
MVTLLPLSPPEFDDYLNDSIRNYAAEKVRAGTWTEAGADVLSKEAFDQLLPQGLDTEHQHLYSIVDEASRNKVGMVWIGVKDRSPVPGAWIWDIIIYEQYRRRGYATETLHALDRLLQTMNIDSLSLHVFGHNAGALSLYEKNGFRPTDITMTKKIGR